MSEQSCDQMIIQSHKGPYQVSFNPQFLANSAKITKDDCHYLVDARVATLYRKQLENRLVRERTIFIDALEYNKSLQAIIPVIEKLVAARIRRGQVLVAIGGGIMQDICCFIASTLLRGVDWHFVPTTLLAQADSCIGSKSSINLGGAKNILGTFNPPRQIYIDPTFLDTLNEREIRSGIGEMLKVHAIAGPTAFDDIAQNFDQLFSDRKVLLHYIRESLLIKQRYIEIDEFDRDVRNIFNYGHSFGHAIEAATEYGIPHGIAVSMGMNLANYISLRRGMVGQAHYLRMSSILQKNYMPFAGVDIPINKLIEALLKDKKNTTTMLGLILPVGSDAVISRVQLPADRQFLDDCESFFDGAYEYHA